MDDLDDPSTSAPLFSRSPNADASNSADSGICVEPTPEKKLPLPLVSNNPPSSPLSTLSLDYISHGTELSDPNETNDTLDGSFHTETCDIQGAVQEGAVNLLVVLISVIIMRCRNLIRSSCRHDTSRGRSYATPQLHNIRHPAPLAAPETGS